MGCDGAGVGRGGGAPAKPSQAARPPRSAPSQRKQPEKEAKREKSKTCILRHKKRKKAKTPARHRRTKRKNARGRGGGARAHPPSTLCFFPFFLLCRADVFVFSSFCVVKYRFWTFSFFHFFWLRSLAGCSAGFLGLVTFLAAASAVMVMVCC